MWLLIPVAVVAIYLWSPLIFWATHRIPLVPTRRLAPGEVPEPLAQAAAEWEAALGEAGFALFGAHELVGNGADGRAGSAARVLHLVTPSYAVHGLDYHTPRQRWQAFDTHFRDGREVITSNFAMPEIFVDPQVHTLRLPRERDMARLYALHQAHVQHVMGSGEDGVLPDRRGMLDYVPERERRMLERQRALGGMTSKGDVYRPTFRGAFRTVWAFLPPLGWIRGRRHARLARTLQAQV
jgi:hypothetical protein